MERESQLAQFGLFDARVPRYTSYPTAPHFSKAIGSSDMAAWLGAIAPGTPLSVYVHVPFCRRLCWFCACRTQGTSSAAPVRAYVEVLKAEIAMVAARIPRGVTLARLHWGGGTPTLIPAELIAELAETLFAAFPPAPDMEFSVEIDPNELGAQRLKALGRAGMNRASIGVQDFDPEIQKTIGRSQSYAVTSDAIEAIRAVGVHSLNADILFGLPHQTPARITDSVQKLLSLSPDRVALYGYAHVPWMARRQVMIPSDTLPTPEERLALFETAARLFSWDGYTAIGIDHFARPGDSLARAAREGRLRRNFQGYTDDAAPVLIGLGASAISRMPGGYAQNAASTSAYIAAVRAGHLATWRGHAFTAEDRLRGRIIEALMCDFRADADGIAAECGMQPDAVAAILAQLDTRFPDMMQRCGAVWTVAPHAHPLTRVIARAVDAYDLSRTGHSTAI